jgi:DNA polymerase
MPWDPNDIRPGWSFVTRKGKHVHTIDAYGGILTENVVQALARDLLYDRALVAEREGFLLVLPNHDELVTEIDESRADPSVLQQIMEDTPAWARNLGVPVGAECWAGERYRK